MAREPEGTALRQEPVFNAGRRGPLTFCGFPGDPGFEDIMHGSVYRSRMRDRLYATLAFLGGTAVEIGAHVGGTTLHLATHFRRVLAFEPSTRNRACLEYNLKLNQLANVVVRGQAVSESSGEARFYLYPPSNACGHSLTESVVAPGAAFETVEVVTLDALEVTDCAFLHIDAEGHDLRVLRGGRDFIRRQQQSPVIALEFSPQMLMRSGSRAEDLIEWMDQLGYNAYLDAGNNWAPISRVAVWEFHRCWAQVCCGWVDLYLLPHGQRLGGLFPEHPE